MRRWRGWAIARLTREHDAYRWICGGVQVNYHTVSDFRVAHGAALDGLVTASVAALLAVGAVKLKRVAQDGMRVRASAGAAVEIVSVKCLGQRLKVQLKGGFAGTVLDIRSKAADAGSTLLAEGASPRPQGSRILGADARVRCQQERHRHGC